MALRALFIRLSYLHPNKLLVTVLKKIIISDSLVDSNLNNSIPDSYDLLSGRPESFAKAR